MISIQKLAKFIDVFNYYPIHVNSLKSKNASDELTFVMTSNTRSSFVKNSDQIKGKSEDEKYLFKLL